MKTRTLIYLAAVMSALCLEAQNTSQKIAPLQAENLSHPLDDYLIRKDPSIGCEPMTEALQKKFNCELFDPGFSKWLITFHEIPGEPPYIMEQKRTTQRDGNTFETAELFTPRDILKAKIFKMPYQFFISARGYLPGEEMTFRLSSKDKKVFREITLCPRPLILRKKSGEILAKAKLGPAPYVMTSYQIDISGIKEGEKFQFISTSAHEKMETSVTGPIYINHLPAVLGLRGGTCKIELKLEDGSSHTLFLPWGNEMAQYHSGKK